MQINSPTPSSAAANFDRAALAHRLLMVRDLAASHRDQILAAAEIQHHRAGTVFCADKRDHEWVYYLIEGTIVATGVDRGVRELEGSASGPLEAFHAPGRLNTGVRAKSDITALRIPLLVLNRFVNVAQAIAAVALPDVIEIGTDESGDGLELALSIGVLSRLATHDIQRLLQRVEEIPVRAGEIIIEQGDRADCCYIVKTGVAEVDIERHGGTQFRVAFKGPGDFFGEEALLMRGTRGATVRMRADGTVLRITDTDFWNLIAPSYIHSVSRAEADALVTQGTVWLDMREPAEFQHGSMSDAINLPEAILRLRCTSLDPRQRYVVCSGNPNQSALGNFMLTAAGLEACYLNEAIGVLEATSRIPFAHDIEQGPEYAPIAEVLELEHEDPSSEHTPSDAPMAELSPEDTLQIGLEDIRAAERQRYQRRLRKVAARLIEAGDARVRAAVQEVEMSYLMELENKHRQVLELKRKVALQHREIWKLKQADARATGEAAAVDRWSPPAPADTI